MRTATVRDLRNRYSAVLKWIEAGEEVSITRRGVIIARLVPEVRRSKFLSFDVNQRRLARAEGLQVGP
jgi:antitoxin (DNA-binding transcriptional repressor) of toxin-antitoxin stability system